MNSHEEIKKSIEEKLQKFQKIQDGKSFTEIELEMMLTAFKHEMRVLNHFNKSEKSNEGDFKMWRCILEGFCCNEYDDGNLYENVEEFLNMCKQSLECEPHLEYSFVRECYTLDGEVILIKEADR